MKRWRRRAIPLLVVIASVAITALMSLLLRGHVAVDMLITSALCAVIVERSVARVTRHYRRKLRAAHDELERRVAERTAALEATTRELVTQDRMANAGMLVASISHEIRSPLQVIAIAVDVAKDPELPREELDSVIGDLELAQQRIAIVLRDLSAFARPIDDPLEPTSLAMVADTVVRLAKYRLADNVTLTRGAFDVPMVLGNVSRLVQLGLNLVTNAIRATDPARPNVVHVDAFARDGRAVLVVTDTGRGMSAETRARLFEPFFTTGAATGGTGLGLSICRALVERMDGAMAIDSVLGEGTRVEVTLPLAATALAA